MTLETAIKFINASLAPAVLFTGVGLLLAGLQTKYSTLASVIRELNNLRRQARETNKRDEILIERKTKQINSLMQRARLVRNAIICFYCTVFLLATSSISLGLNILNVFNSSISVFTLFGLALAFLFSGIWNATREAFLSYKIVQLETSDE
ncbi:DUF2721 domain-containing protein [Puniceicoccaceae bacterium K14]|nr:DUF2721 domain-containing protein [Puniceicoccaceae bacterium K14]